MPPCGRRRPTQPGAWVPSGLPGEGRGASTFNGQGPDSLDVECKASLQKLLRPSHYGAIDVWMRNHGKKDKKGIVLLAEAAVGENGVAVQQDRAFAAQQQNVQLNPRGRHVVADAVHVTADRQQVDLLKIRCSADQVDKDLIRRRKFLKDFAPIPSQESVHEFYRLSEKPVSEEPGAKVLSEDARRGLTRWQIRGPEQNREETAQICKALRSLSSAVDACPTYTDELRNRREGGKGCADCLHGYGQVKRAARSGTYMRRVPTMQPGRGLARSMPTLPPKYIEDEDLKNVQRPGGYIVGMMDVEPLQFAKNRMRGITSKMCQGGATSYETSYNAGMCCNKPSL